MNGRRRLIATVVLPLGIVAATAITVSAMLGSLPDPVASHFGFQGRADGFLSRALVLPVLVGLQGGVTALLALAVVRSGPAIVADRLLVALPASVAALVGGIVVVTLRGQVGLADATEAVFSGATTTWPFVAALVAGGVANLVAPDAVPVARTPQAPPPDAPRVELGAAPAVWQGVTPTAVVMQVVAGALVVLSGILWLVTAPFVGGVTLLVLVPLLGSSKFTVTIGPGGLVVRGVLGWPRVHLPLESIERAGVGNANPLRLGGWGIRILGQTTAVLTRHGPALEVVRHDGSRLLVSMDDPQVPAGVLNSLLDARAAMGPQTGG